MTATDTSADQALRDPEVGTTPAAAPLRNVNPEVGGQMNADGLIPQIVYWHRELPPANAEVLGDGVIEATSSHTVAAVPHCDELWHSHRYSELMAQARMRVEQEVRRLKGNYAHVLSESVATRRNDASGEAWLHGKFSYVLLRAPDRRTPDAQQCPDGGSQDKGADCGC